MRAVRHAYGFCECVAACSTRCTGLVQGRSKQLSSWAATTDTCPHWPNLGRLDNDAPPCLRQTTSTKTVMQRKSTLSRS